MAQTTLSERAFDTPSTRLGSGIVNGGGPLQSRFWTGVPKCGLPASLSSLDRIWLRPRDTQRDISKLAA